jgi:hypothetical protein
MVIKRLGKIAIGCFGILIILIILGAVFGGIIVKKVITGAIEHKTGVQVNVDDINKGKLTYTDPKTGAQLNIGSNKIPDDFPKDFPIYPGASVTTSASQPGESAGNWLTLTSSDTVDQINAFYNSNLKANGWTANSNGSSNGVTSWTVSKGVRSGSVLIQRQNGESQTSIIIVLGQGTPVPSATTSTTQ